MTSAGLDYVHVRRVSPHPANIRRDLGDLSGLSATIAAHGILQPLIVEPDPAKPGHYTLIAGHRRLAAAKLAGLDEVPITIRSPQRTPQAAVVTMLIENCQRADLDPVDKAQAMGRLLRTGMNAAAIARATGLAPSTVSYHLQLLKLSADTLERLRTGVLPAGAVHDAVKTTTRSPTTIRGHRRRPAVAACPPHFTATHPLAAAAHARCEAERHPAKGRLGRVACGACWEHVIRAETALASRREAS